MKQWYGEDIISDAASIASSRLHATGSVGPPIFVVFKVGLVLLLTLMTGTAFPDNVNGAWLSPSADNWPFVPLHAVLMPDGRVLTYGSKSDGKASGFFSYDVWDPEEGLSGGHTTLQNMTLTDIFCSYAVILPTNGNILIAGGDNWNGTVVENTGNDDSNIFTVSDSLLTRGNDMRRPRWYATATPLMNGEVYIQGGKNGEDVAEIRDVYGQFRELAGVQTSTLEWWYPRNFLAPDGRVFGIDNYGQMYFVNPAGQGSLTFVGQMDPTHIGRSSTTVMYRPGKILHVAAKSKKTWVIDINGNQPTIKVAKPLLAKRVWASSTVLADGKVLVTGGSAVDEVLTGVTNYSEIWDPQTGNWTRGAEGLRARLYHSVALLLPDASVLVAGGGASNEAPVDQLHGEIYYPPYLFNASGAFASRPVITSAPGVVEAGTPFSMEVNTTSIQRVTLMQVGMATHSVNLQQRFSELSFTKVGNSLTVSMPTRSTDVPPGYYMLFAINGNGVPSKARIVRINVDSGSGGGQDTTPPSKPAGFKVTLSNGDPKLVFDPSSDNVGVAGYDVYRSTNGTLGPLFAQVVGSPWIDSSAQAGTTYTYVVRARDAAGNLSLATAPKSATAQ